MPPSTGKRDAGDVAAGVAGEENQCGAELFGPAESPGQGAGQDGGIEVAAVELVGHLGFEVAGRERVDPDALAAGPLLGEIARQADQTGLRRRVGGLRQPRGGQAQHTADVDDRATRLHHRRAGLRHPVAAVQIDVDDRTELIGGFAGGRYSGAHPGVVHQDVHPPECFSRGADQRLAVIRVGDVGTDRQRVAAHRLHQRAGVGQSLLAPRAEHHVGARLGEGMGERDAEAAGRAGDDGDPVVESEAVEDGDFSS